jgi:dynein heavy chain, axonemal
VRSKLPPDYNLTEVREIIKKISGPKGLNDKGMTVPLNVFLFQEISRF